MIILMGTGNSQKTQKEYENIRGAMCHLQKPDPLLKVGLNESTFQAARSFYERYAMYGVFDARTRSFWCEASVEKKIEEQERKMLTLDTCH